MYAKMSEAKKKFWASKTPEERSQINSERAKKAWSKRSKKYGKTLSKKMTLARYPHLNK